MLHLMTRSVSRSRVWAEGKSLCPPPPKVDRSHENVRKILEVLPHTDHDPK
jgi:hypothetical protein